MSHIPTGYIKCIKCKIIRAESMKICPFCESSKNEIEPSNTKATKQSLAYTRLRELAHGKSYSEFSIRRIAEMCLTEFIRLQAYVNKLESSLSNSIEELKNITSKIEKELNEKN